MKDVIIKHISLSNFCNIKSLSADLTKKTIIKGFNKEGKSTIFNAILWTLTDKLSDGSAAGDSIRPHDNDGKRIDGVDITVSLTVSIDGSEFILTKTQKQKWVKKRGSEDRDFQGNENLYEISGVPKKAKDYESFIDENICKVADLSFCINANTFLALDAKKRRAKVLSLAKEFTNDEIIDKFPEFEPLRSDLKIGTWEELTARSKKAISEYKKRQVEIPVRIDETNNSIKELDFAEIELYYNDIHERLNAIALVDAQQTEIRKDINKAQIELQTVKEKLTGAARDAKHNLELEKQELRLSLSKSENEVSMLKHKIEQYRQVITTGAARIIEDETLLNEAVNEEYDANSFVCPTCGQLFPVEKQEAKRAEFEEAKASKIARLSECIESEKKAKADNEKLLKASEAKLSEMESEAECIREEITTKDMEMASMPDASAIDYENDPEYKTVLQKISDLETKLTACVPADDKNDLMEQLAEVNRQLAQKDVNIQAEERIGDLKAELKDVAEKQLKQEAMLNLLEQFNIKRIEMLEGSVNQYFDRIKWVFWKQLINMGYEAVCVAEVDGTSYDGLLNKSDRLLCKADLVLGFQRALGISLPILIDDVESVDSNRIPEYDRQTILFKRDDCKLTVESV